MQDAMFETLYWERCRKANKTTLTNAELQEVFDDYQAFLKAKFKSLSDSITYQFDKSKYTPEIVSVVIEVQLATGETTYKFTDYDVLQDTMLVALFVPVTASTRYSQENNEIAGNEIINQAYITLTNDRQQKVRDNEPLVDYIRDGAYIPEKAQFAESRLDWKQCFLSFPSTDAPNAADGKVIQLVVYYIDLKRYEYA